MKANVEGSDSRLDWVKWVLVAAITGAAVWANLHYASEPLLYRFMALLVVAVIAAAIALQTTQGLAFWDLAKAARTEIRKVVWPTRQETTTTTAIVVAVVAAASLILWLLDTFLGWLASKLIG